jgi:hypothetical protein
MITKKPPSGRFGLPRRIITAKAKRAKKEKLSALLRTPYRGGVCAYILNSSIFSQPTLSPAKTFNSPIASGRQQCYPRQKWCQAPLGFPPRRIITAKAKRAKKENSPPS